MSKIQRVSSDDPARCQGTTKHGECSYKANPGSSFCPLHGGQAGVKNEEARELRQYRLNTAYGTRAKEMSQAGAVKNLQDEITLMRVALETVFNSIKSENDMVLYMDKIHKLTDGIGKLAATWQKMQMQNKELLGRETVMAIFDALLEKIVELVPDPDTVRQLAEEGYLIISKGIGDG